MIKQNESKYRALRNHLLEASLIALGITDATAEACPCGLHECAQGQVWRMPPAVGSADATVGAAAIAGVCAQPIVLKPRKWKEMFRASVPMLTGTAVPSPPSDASGGEASGPREPETAVA